MRGRALHDVMEVGDLVQLAAITTEVGARDSTQLQHRQICLQVLGLGPALVRQQAHHLNLSHSSQLPGQPCHT